MSNKTPKAAAEKTASVPNKSSKKPAPQKESNLFYYIVYGFFGLVLCFCAWILWSPQDSGSSDLPAVDSDHIELSFRCIDKNSELIAPGNEASAETCQTAQFLKADTQSLRTQGLSGRESNVSEPGMFFVFDDDSQHEIWMKDMKFPLHLVWLDNNKRVVDITYDVPPDTYPKTFTSAKPARYLIEIDANFAKKDEVPFSVGDQVYF